MASPFLAIGAGLTQGLAGGIQAGANLVTQQRQMAIQQQQADAANLTAFSNALKIPDPSVRDLAVNRLMKPALGVDPTSDVGKKTLATIKTTNDENLAALSAALPGMPKAAIYAIMSDPAQMANMLYKITAQKNLQAVLSNLPDPNNPNATQPTGTGDMGTGASGAGGAVAAPTADAGTSTSGTQPVVSPAPSSTAQPAVVSSAPATTQPTTSTAQAAPIQAGTPPAAAAQSTTTQTAPALPRVAVGQSANGQTVSWDPNNDPFVKTMQKIILNTSLMPGVTPEVMSALNSRLSQYVDGQKFKFTQYIDMQNLAVSRGNLGVAQYRASLDREHLNLEEQQAAYHQGGAAAEPLSELAKQQHDVQTGQLSGGALSGGTVSPTIGSSPARPTPATLTSIPSTEVQLPANVKPDISKATNNKDGTFTFSDAATLKAAGVSDDVTRLVYDAPTGKYYFQTATPTSMRTKENVDQAQIGLNTVQRGYNFVDNTIKLVDASPASFGAYGAAKANLQTLVGIAKDIGTQFPTATDLLNATGLSKLPFDPVAPTLDGISQFLAAYVNKTLTTAGGSAGISAYGVTDKNIKDLTDVGGGSSNDVKAHLVQIKNLMAQARQDFQSRLPTGGTSGVPDTTGGTAPQTQPQQPTQEKETPLQSKYDKWQSMSKEEQKPLIGTKYDMRPSTIPTDPDGDSHLDKIPVGQIILLRESLKTFTNPVDQKALRDMFKQHFGRTSVARLKLDG